MLALGLCWASEDGEIICFIQQAENVFRMLVRNSYARSGNSRRWKPAFVCGEVSTLKDFVRREVATA
jgi:hypothetical protein